MISNISLIKSFGYAYAGILHAARENRNLRLHFLLGALALLLGIIFGLNRFEMIVIVVMTVMVISAEMINTSLEEMTDLITSEHRQEAKIAKDVAAGMVLVVSVGAAIIGAYIFVPYILRLSNF